MSVTNSNAAAVEEATRWIGVETVYDGVDEVTRSDIRRKLEVFCFDCPIFTNDGLAQAHGYRSATAPLAMIPLWALPAYWSPGDPPIFGPGLREQDGTARSAMALPWKNGLNASSEVEFFEPVYPGDRLTSIHKLVQVTPKTTRLGEGAFLTFETIIRKQSGERVAVRHNTGFRYDAESGRERSAERGARAEAVDVSAVSPYNEPVDWSRQLRFGDIAAGDVVPSYNLWLSYQRIVMSVAVDRMFSGIHHNRDFARQGNLDDIIFNTRGYEMLLELMLRSWIGLDGRISKMGPAKMKAAGHPGDTLIAGGTVKALERSEVGGNVTLDVWVDSPRGRGTIGEATVWVPS